MNASFDFNPFVKDIDLTIIWPECGTKQTFNVIPPMPNFYADTHSESCNYDYEARYCEKCGFEFELDLNCGTGSFFRQERPGKDRKICKDPWQSYPSSDFGSRSQWH